MVSKNISMLIVEDDPAHRLLIKSSLQGENSGNEISEVTNGQEALDYVYGRGDYGDRKKFPYPQLILLDVKMPGLDGFETLRRLKSDPDKTEIPIVIFTTSGRTEEIQKGYKLGANAFITKPLDFDEFANKLKTLKLFWTTVSEMPKVADSDNAS